MAPEEIWLAKLFNDYLSGMGNAFLKLVGMPTEPRPWANFIVMELLVGLIIVVLFAFLRPRLSVDRPGKLQHTFEVIYDFVHGQADDVVGHGGANYMAFFGTLFVFILFSNLIGIVPGLESPTMNPSVTAGCALVTFCYYNLMGLREQGVLKYALHFAGPIWWLAWLMLPIEIVSHMARPLSLSVRLYANMFAGEQVTTVFLGMTYLLVPAIFMGLHVFVSLLQAYIFMLLTMMYVSGAVSHEH
ncbi:MAG TPA: F0F1 ATP synthase subunit A [Bryobacteraceae bacterium]|nr:F0F1 ATP synthase subunit A [Bryobacteraceae bacterium]